MALRKVNWQLDRLNFHGWYARIAYDFITAYVFAHNWLPNAIGILKINFIAPRAIDEIEIVD